MPSSLHSIYLHIVFSTKLREPLILPEIESDLFSFLSDQCKTMNHIPIAVGGYKDHVHILCRAPKKFDLPALLQEIKINSSIWMKQHLGLEEFYWQRGYACFSVSPYHVNTVTNYIKNQKEHHESQNYKQELLFMLHRSRVTFDHRYLWD